MLRVVQIAFMWVVSSCIGTIYTVESRNETKYEKETVQFSCSTKFEHSVIWAVNNTLQRKLREKPKSYGGAEYIPIYTGDDVYLSFKQTGRYNVSKDKGVYTLTISELDVSETGPYFCHENWASGPLHMYYLSVLVNVSHFDKNETLLVYAGNNVTLPCNATRDDQVEWWYIKSENAPQHVIFSNSPVESNHRGRVPVNRLPDDYNLTLDNVLLNESGWYICINYGINKQYVYLDVHVNVSHFDKNETLLVYAGNNVTLPCNATRDDQVEWWYIKSKNAPQHVIFSNSPVESNHRGRVPVNRLPDDYNLTLDNVLLNESGWYICINYGINKHHVYLDVHVNVSHFDKNETLLVYAGNNVTLPCNATRDDQVEWWYIKSENAPQHVIFSNSPVESNHRGRVPVNRLPDDYNLTLDNVLLNESGWYICINYGIIKHHVYLDVHVNVSHFDKNETLLVYAGNNVTLPCNATRDDQVEWWYIKSENAPQHVIFSNSPVESNHRGRVPVNRLPDDYNLTLDNVLLNESGWYICINYGIIKHHVYLDVHGDGAQQNSLNLWFLFIILGILVGVGLICSIVVGVKKRDKINWYIRNLLRSKKSVSPPEAGTGGNDEMEPLNVAVPLEDQIKTKSQRVKNLNQAGAIDKYLNDCGASEASPSGYSTASQPRASRHCDESLVDGAYDVMNLVSRSQTNAEGDLSDNVTSQGRVTRSLLQRLASPLIKYIEPDFLMLNELVCLKVLDSSDREYIESVGKNVVEQNKLLLNFLLEKSDDELGRFLLALDASDQAHVANWIEFQRDGKTTESSGTESDDVWPLSDDQMSIINKNRSKLQHLLDTKYDLLPAMRATKCLKCHQIDSLQTLLDNYQRNNALLNMLLRRSVAQFNEFIECLEKHQRHLIPFLTGDEALWNESDGAHRPLDDDLLTRISSNWREIREFIEWDSGLLVELYSICCISRIQRRSMEESVEETRNDIFLHILIRKSNSEFKKFLSCLSRTRQEHVAALIMGNAVEYKSNGDKPVTGTEVADTSEKLSSYTSEETGRGEMPLRDDVRERLHRIKGTLMNIINVNIELLANLVGREFISDADSQNIDAETTLNQMNAKIVEIIMRGSEKNLQCFKDVLTLVGQGHVVKYMERGEVLPIHVQFTDENASPEREESILAKLRNFVSVMPENWTDEIMPVELSDDQRTILVNSLRNLRAVIVGAHLTQSIMVYVYCSTLPVLESVWTLFQSAQLNEILETICQCLSNDDMCTVLVSVSQEDYVPCKKELSSSEKSVQPTEFDTRVNQEIKPLNVAFFSWRKQIEDNTLSLVEIIEPDHGLLIKLRSSGVTNNWTSPHLEDQLIMKSQIVRDLLLHIHKRTDEDFELFCSALRNTNQNHVVDELLMVGGTDLTDSSAVSFGYLMDAIGQGDESELQRLLVPEWKHLIKVNRNDIIKELEVSDALLNDLVKYQVMNDLARGEITSVKGAIMKRGELLLDYMQRRPNRDFACFRFALEKCGQAGVIDKYLNDRDASEVSQSMPSPASTSGISTSPLPRTSLHYDESLGDGACGMMHPASASQTNSEGDLSAHDTSQDTHCVEQRDPVTSSDEIKSYEIPPQFKMHHYDVFLVYTPEDAKLAAGLQFILEKCITLDDTRPPRVVTTESPDLAHVSSKIDSVKEAIDRSTYMFLLYTENSGDDSWMKWLQETCSIESIQSKQEEKCIIPVVYRKNKFNLPFGLCSYKEVDITYIFPKEETELSLEKVGDSNPPAFGNSRLNPKVIEILKTMFNMRIKDKLDRQAEQDKQENDWCAQEKEKRRKNDSRTHYDDDD